MEARYYNDRGKKVCELVSRRQHASFSTSRCPYLDISLRVPVQQTLLDCGNELLQAIRRERAQVGPH